MFKKIDKILLYTSVALFVIGLVAVFSASNVTAYNKGLGTAYYFRHQLILTIIGFIAAIAIMGISLKTEGKVSFLLLLVVTAALVYLVIWGNEYYGAKSWISVGGGFTIQPSEFAKIISIVWIPFMIFSQKTYSGWTKYLIVCFFVVVSFFFIAAQPDLGTAIIYGLICLILFLVIKEDPEKKKKISIFGAGAVVVVLLALLVFISSNPNAFERQMGRIKALGQNPCSEENFYKTGTQRCNGYIAFKNGGLTGKGLGDSPQKYLYLPEAHTDFIALNASSNSLSF